MFFTQLYEHLKNGKIAINLSVAVTDAQMTVAVKIQPLTNGEVDEDHAFANLPPFTMTGTPEDFDNEFFDKFGTPALTVSNGLKVNDTAFTEAIKEEQESEAKDAVATEKRKQKAGVTKAEPKKLTFKEQVTKAIEDGDIPKAIKARDAANAGGGLPNIEVARLTMMIAKAKFDNKFSDFAIIIGEAMSAISLLSQLKAPAKEMQEYNNLLYEIKKAKMVADMDEEKPQPVTEVVSDNITIPAPVKRATIKEIADASPNVIIAKMPPNPDAEISAKYHALQGLDDDTTDPDTSVDTPLAEQLDENLSDVDQEGTDFNDVDDDF
jgi:PRTRC genetic system protein E